MSKSATELPAAINEALERCSHSTLMRLHDGRWRCFSCKQFFDLLELDKYHVFFAAIAHNPQIAQPDFVSPIQQEEKLSGN